MNWLAAQGWEQNWWDKCINTYGEETKQLLYAECMGLESFHDGKSPYNFDLCGVSVLDIGGGPTSLLLKCINFTGKIVDPLQFPDWVLARYEAAGIEFQSTPAEDIDEEGWDECWIYNVLQHVRCPETVVRNARAAAGIVRLFEWIDTPTNVGHLNSLSAAKLDKWLDGAGKVIKFEERDCFGVAYYGVFLGYGWETNQRVTL